MVTSPQLKGRDQCERKRKTTSRDDKMILQNTFRDLRKTSEDLQRDLATAGVTWIHQPLESDFLKLEEKPEVPARSNC